MECRFLLHLGLIGLILLPGLLQSQSNPCPFANLPESRLTETWWAYTSTVHLATGKPIHRNDGTMGSHLHFRYDHTAEMELNGRITAAPWALLDGRLDLAYRGRTGFCLRQPDTETLHLVWAEPQTGQYFAYVFRAIDPASAPFPRPWYELPTILVERKRSGPSQPSAPWWAFWRRWFGPDGPPAPPPVPIRIEVAGGGYYGGLNPVYRQFVTISSEGRLIREVQTARDGLMVTRRNIPRQELEAFARWIEDQGFFELAGAYDCQVSLCHKRKREKPLPMPLSVMVTLGQKTRTVRIPIFGEDNRHVRYIEYPVLIDRIVETVYRMAEEQEN